ncbi:import inner membrane translocase subunit Tim44 [Gluconacetobacter diazotrophicus PA1 5]|nr:Tim44-like domain-containing protein [Gluconacetobacter diazotrophicus]ACI50108.1 import inner membrane translocase subunit Tim44 [Gluconacetobacter diazotrophicus PA1 5]MBB2158206.1 Tim44 domain-containing protein [Gluconacetobacter diazotrophicus]TWB07812.1 putative lipid-binding transport protein (Tim44 family) [Gluconacetobacter diazotrophicus]
MSTPTTPARPPRPRRAAILLLGTALAALPLLGLPQGADARPGSGLSMGSRGSRTYSAPAPTTTSPYGAAPMQQSIMPRSAPGYGGAPSAFPRSPYGVPYGSPYAARPHPFANGFLGGLLGAGLFGVLFGHGIAGGLHGGGSFLGFLIQLVLLFLLVGWLVRRFGGGARRTAPMPAAPYGQGPSADQVTITPDDYRAFQRLLLDIQAAWSQRNLPALQHMATPEMVGYFNAQLSDLASRGARNVVSDVRFEQGDLSEAWSENGFDYATVAMRYSMVDITTDMTGRVIDGSSTERVMVTELWTFVRPTRGGAWLLSAIQQGR